MSDLPPFVHLRVHSDFTMGRGASKLKNLVKKAVAFGQPAMALTDENNLYGALKFSETAMSSGLQPILGADVVFAKSADNSGGSVILLAQSDQGYANICRIVNGALDARPIDPTLYDEAADVFELRTEPKPGVFDIDRIRYLIDRTRRGDSEPTKGIIALIGGGEQDYFRDVIGKPHAAKHVATLIKGLQMMFPDRIYIEICRNEAPTAAAIEREAILIEAARETSAPLVATTDIFYDVPSRQRAYEVLRASNEQAVGSIVTHEDGITPRFPTMRHMRSTEEMIELFSDLPEAIANTVTVARRCGFAASKRKPILPPFKTEGGRTEDDELRVQSHEGLNDRFASLGIPESEWPAYRERLDYELGIIIQMQFPGYFLIVSDFIKWAKARKIPVGPGRGSGAGSVVAWSLTITDLDPLRFGLLFERFLNPERVSMPDFDIDFCQDRRMEVIEYVGHKYGMDKVAQIVTFTELKPKSALKDAARVTRTADLPPMAPNRASQLSGLVPFAEGSKVDHMPLKVAFEKDERFRNEVSRDQVNLASYLNALEIEGITRNSSAHAAGVIIAGRRLTDLVPAGFDPKTGFPIVQFNMKDSENAGLVKFDFLGLKTLSVIRLTLEYIQQETGEYIDLSTVSLDDAPTYEMLAQGRSNGVFQFESEGMKRVLTSIKPNRFEDLIAVAALYRPGPMDMIPTYARCKNGEEEPFYPEPREQTKMFLEETFGIMVYQEQVMQVAQVVAGYSLGGADLLRRAMGKKIKEEMEIQKATFVEGAFKNGTSKAEAARLFDLIEKFAGYGFNKSHAAAYALIAYHTAWLKRHHPAAFYSAIMSYEDKAEKLAPFKQDMDTENPKITLLPPDINKSVSAFAPEGPRAVRFGIKAIKGITGADALVRVRGDKPFTSLDDYSRRAGPLFDSAQMQKLVEAGAFTELSSKYEGHRAMTHRHLTLVSKQAKPTDQVSMDLDGETDFGLENAAKIPEWVDLENREFQATGFFFSGHPVDKFWKSFGRYERVRKRRQYIDHLSSRGLHAYTSARLMGIVLEVYERPNTRGYPHLQIVLSEKDDIYHMRWSPPPGNGGRSIQEHTFGALKGHKLNRTVVVAECKLNYWDKIEDYTIEAKTFVSAREFAADNNIQHTLRLTLDTSALRLKHAETHQLRYIRQQLVNEAAEQPLLQQYSDVIQGALKERLRLIAHELKTRGGAPKDGEGSTLMVEVLYSDENKKIHHAELVKVDGVYNGEGVTKLFFGAYPEVVGLVERYDKNLDTTQNTPLSRAG